MIKAKVKSSQVLSVVHNNRKAIHHPDKTAELILLVISFGKKKTKQKKNTGLVDD